jgi:hypothetical protein
MTENNFQLCHYAVAFIDLLGQRAELRAHPILPDDLNEAIALAKRTVGRVRGVHKLFESFWNAHSNAPSLFDQVVREHGPAMSIMRKGELRYQRFSDGLVVFASLAEGQDHSTLNGVYGLLMAAGSLCLCQLAKKQPVRIGIDVGWGVEHNPGELYGAALAHAYELESHVAQWPRAVVGRYLVDYLTKSASVTGESMPDRYRRDIAQECLDTLCQDSDGQVIVDFAGERFRTTREPEKGNEVVQLATQYVDEQIEKWSRGGNAVLSGRYACLKRYLESRTVST